MVGNTAKSSGRIAYTATNKTTKDNAILKEKNRSSSIAGMGNVIMPKSANRANGIPRLPLVAACID
jgi:hypothetical protein